MATYHVTPEQLPELIKQQMERQRGVAAEARVAAARRFESHMVKETKRAGKINTGEFQAGWKTTITGAGDNRTAKVVNDAPHAGIIELGARPHPVSEEGIEAIAQWALRKLALKVDAPIGPVRRGTTRKAFGKSEAYAQAVAIARRVALKLRREGQKGTFLVRDNLDKAGAFFMAEFDRLMRGLENTP